MKKRKAGYSPLELCCLIFLLFIISFIMLVIALVIIRYIPFWKNQTRIDDSNEEISINQINETVFNKKDQSNRQIVKETTLKSVNPFLIQETTEFFQHPTTFTQRQRYDFEKCDENDSLKYSCGGDSNQWYDYIQRCDGFETCSNGADEYGCESFRRITELKECEGAKVSCPNEYTKIEYWRLCDGVTDCRESYDEVDCISPGIDFDPKYHIHVFYGKPIVMSCFVSGKPLPQIHWRHNNTCYQSQPLFPYGESDRVKSFTETYGKLGCFSAKTHLIIESADWTDSGTYSCQGLTWKSKTDIRYFQVFVYPA